MEYDIAIIGGGPAGYNAAEKAAVNGFKTVLFEKDELGGVCLNEGCIPTKTFLYSAKLLDNIQNAGKYGLEVSGFAADHLKILQRKNKIVKKLTAGVKYKLTANGVDIVKGYATLQGESGESIQITCSGSVYQVRYVLLCTGSETILPPIKGLAESNYWTSKEALETAKLPKSLTVIGGGVIGIELASYFNRLGVKVTVVEMMPKILGRMDKEISDMFQADLQKRGVQLYLNTKVVEVKEDNAIIEKEEKTEEIVSEKVLVCIGRKVNVTGLGLENFSIEVENGAVKVNRFMQTSHPRIYAAGDITGYSLLAHTAIREGEVAINHLLDQADEMDYKAIPSVVYTHPEIAGVGKTEEELQSSGIYYRVLKLPMTYSGRFMIENEGVNGLCKLIIDEQNRIIGCHMIGNQVSELITIAAIAVEEEYTTEYFRRFVFPHPTVGEILREVSFE